MCSYNAINGVPSCANSELLQGVLRDKWDYEGIVATDCGAIEDVYDHHNYTKTPEEAV